MTRRTAIARVVAHLSTVGLCVGVVAFALAALFMRSPADRDGLLTIGGIGWLMWGVGYMVVAALTRPEVCAYGHSDIGFYYGRWSCRTCYRLAKRRASARTDHGKDKRGIRPNPQRR